MLNKGLQAALSTHSREMRTPPQWNEPLYSTRTCQGQEWGAASCPPTIRTNVGVIAGQPQVSEKEIHSPKVRKTWHKKYP